MITGEPLYDFPPPPRKTDAAISFSSLEYCFLPPMFAGSRDEGETKGGESEFHSRSGTGSGPTSSFPTTNIPRIPGHVCVCVRELLTIRWATMEERGKKAYDGGNQIKPPPV